MQLQGPKGYDKQIVIKSATFTGDVSLAREVQKHLSNAARKHGLINQGKYKKGTALKKWTEREYHVQDYSDVVHKYGFKILILTNFSRYNSLVHTQNHIE